VKPCHYPDLFVLPPISSMTLNYGRFTPEGCSRVARDWSLVITQIFSFARQQFDDIGRAGVKRKDTEMTKLRCEISFDGLSSQ
jgi:hypothetical protein